MRGRWRESDLPQRYYICAAVWATRRPDRWPARNVNLFGLGHERITCQRVGVFAADQIADPADFCVDDFEAAPSPSAQISFSKKVGTSLR